MLRDRWWLEHRRAWWIVAAGIAAACFAEPPPKDAGSSSTSSSSEPSGSSSAALDSSTSSTSSDLTSTEGAGSSSGPGTSEDETSESTSGVDPALVLWHTWDGDYVDMISGDEGVPTGDASVNTSALELHGAGSVDISYFSPAYTEALESMTVSIRYFANTGDGLRPLLALGDTGESMTTNTHRISINDGVFVLLTETGAGVDHIVALGEAPSFVIGAWHTVTFVFDGATVTTCSDGTWLSEAEYVPAQTLAAKCFVGGTSIPGEGWDGLIDELRIWDGPLESVCE